MRIPPARPASTVVLVRPSRRRFDVFLVRRHDQTTFGGAHVFPGGRVDDADVLESPEKVCDGVTAARARLSDLPPADAIAHYVAAIRELFEEAGILLARRDDGRTIEFTNPTERFLQYRRALANGTMALSMLVERERVWLALDRLVAFAHWVTPAMETARFDTRFFVAVVPDGQEPVHDDSETTHSDWMDPDDAVEACRRDDIVLPAPTWTTLRALAKLTTVEEVIRWARQQQIVRVQPGCIKTDAVTMLTLPGDPKHPPLVGFDTPEETRFVLENGRWRPAKADPDHPS